MIFETLVFVITGLAYIFFIIDVYSFYEGTPSNYHCFSIRPSVYLSCNISETPQSLTILDLCRFHSNHFCLSVGWSVVYPETVNYFSNFLHRVLHHKGTILSLSQDKVLFPSKKETLVNGIGDIFVNILPFKLFTEQSKL